MSKPATEIEVEVCSIDDVSPVTTRPRRDESRQPSWQDWRQWQGKIYRLDSRWLPLRVLLGALAIVLMLTVGLVCALLFLAVKAVSGLLRAVFR